MLITDGNLNFEEFKSLVPTLNWKKAPRWVGKREETFLIGYYEDDSRKIQVSVRPSLRMQVTETFKNYTTQGVLAPENYTGQKVDWGSSVEVIITQKFIDDVHNLATPAEQTSNMKKMDW